MACTACSREAMLSAAEPLTRPPPLSPRPPPLLEPRSCGRIRVGSGASSSPYCPPPNVVPERPRFFIGSPASVPRPLPPPNRPLPGRSFRRCGVPAAAGRGGGTVESCTPGSDT